MEKLRHPTILKVILAVIMLLILPRYSDGQCDDPKADCAPVRPHEEIPSGPPPPPDIPPVPRAPILRATPHPPIIIPVPSGTAVPTASFETFSLFLVTTEHWNNFNFSEVDQLHESYKHFGEAIGQKHVAVWFTNADGKGVDLARAKTFANLFELQPNNGPFLVLTRSNPEHMGPEKPVVIISFSGINATRIERVLNLLEEDLKNQRQIRNRQLLWEEIKQRALTLKENNPDFLGVVLKVP